MNQIAEVGVVKRYIVEEVMDGYSGRVATAIPNGGGEFVKYEDYAALEARVYELEKEAASYRRPDPHRGETKGMREWNGEYYTLGSTEPAHIRNESYEHKPMMGDM